MDGSVLAWRWLSHGAVGGLILLCLGSLSVWLCGQPVRRARIVVLTLLGGFAVPWLGLVSIVPRWSAGIVLPVPRSSRPLSGNTGAVTATGTPAIAIPQTERSATQVASLSEPTAIVKTALIESVGKKPKAALVPSLFIATSWETVLLSAYAALSLGWIAWWLIGQVLIWRITRAARLVSPTIHEVFLEISGPAGHRVTVLESATVDLPFTFTWLRPVIVLPTALCADGDSQELRFCLAHEWSHIERRDALAWNFAALVGCVFFYQPLFWWLRRQLRLCQDYLADDRAAALASAEDYAAYLVRLARRDRPS